MWERPHFEHFGAWLGGLSSWRGRGRDLSLPTTPTPPLTPTRPARGGRGRGLSPDPHNATLTFR